MALNQSRVYGPRVRIQTDKTKATKTGFSANAITLASGHHFHRGSGGRASIEAFCLRMLHKKYFDVSNRWYVPDLHVSKMAIVATTFSVMKVVFFFFPCVT